MIKYYTAITALCVLSMASMLLCAALSLVLMVLVFVCTGIMNRFGGDEAEGGVVV